MHNDGSGVLPLTAVGIAVALGYADNYKLMEGQTYVRPSTRFRGAVTTNKL
jgi:hypothetical protein